MQRCRGEIRPPRAEQGIHARTRVHDACPPLVRSVAQNGGHTTRVQRALRLTALCGVAVFVGIVFLLLPQRAYGADLYWMGNNPGNYADRDNWSTAPLPSCQLPASSKSPEQGDTLHFGSGCTDRNFQVGAPIAVVGVLVHDDYVGTITFNNGLTVSSSLIQAGGAIVGSSNQDHVMTVHNLLLTGGTFNAPARLAIKESMRLSGGDFQGGSTTLRLEAVDINSPGTLYIDGNFGMSVLESGASGLTVRIVNGTTLTVNDGLYIEPEGQHLVLGCIREGAGGNCTAPNPDEPCDYSAASACGVGESWSIIAPDRDFTS